MTDGQARKFSAGLRQAAEMVESLWSPEGNVSARGGVQEANRKATAAKANGARTLVPGAAAAKKAAAKKTPVTRGRA
jgi:hypothetical protein